MKPTRFSSRGHAGFTLMELMVVLVLIGILSAAIIPEMRGTFDDALLRSSSRQLVQSLSMAYSRAVSSNQAHRFRLDRSTGRFVLERQARSRGGRGAFVQVRDLAGSTGEIDPRIAVEFRQPQNSIPDRHGSGRERGSAEARPGRSGPTGPAESIVFHPDGTADATEIVLRDRAGFRLVLRLNPVTARVQVFERDFQ